VRIVLEAAGEGKWSLDVQGDEVEGHAIRVHRLAAQQVEEGMRKERAEDKQKQEQNIGKKENREKQENVAQQRQQENSKVKQEEGERLSVLPTMNCNSNNLRKLESNRNKLNLSDAGKNSLHISTIYDLNQSLNNSQDSPFITENFELLDKERESSVRLNINVDSSEINCQEIPCRCQIF